jgi:hypothetical protein
MKPSHEAVVDSNCHEVFADGVAMVTPLGPVTHVLFTARQRSTYENRIDRVVQLRLILPTEHIQAIGRAILSGEVSLRADQFGNEVPMH